MHFIPYSAMLKPMPISPDPLAKFTLQDFALTQMPAATLSGVVYDSATNWPLYASIALDGDESPDALHIWHYDGANAWTEVGSGDYGYSGAVCTDDCRVERGGISAFSPFTIGGITAPTAITLATVAAQNGVYIVWGLALLGLGLVFVLRRRKS